MYHGLLLLSYIMYHGLLLLSYIMYHVLLLLSYIMYHVSLLVLLPTTTTTNPTVTTTCYHYAAGDTGAITAGDPSFFPKKHMSVEASDGSSLFHSEYSFSKVSTGIVLNPPMKVSNT